MPDPRNDDAAREAADRKGATWDQVRHATVVGRTGDKVKYPDFAAAPLGADEEAGGATTSPREIGRMLEHERATASQTMDRASNEAPDTRRKTTWILFLVAAAVIAGAVLIYLWRAG